jgi:hypothetical protein
VRKRPKKKRWKKLFHPVYRFGKDVHKLVLRAKATLKSAEQRLEEDLRARRKGKGK